ncbi:MAG: 4Fe-4S binding protein [Pseudomonadota bacterium]
MASPMWLVELIKKTFPGIFFLARLTRFPLVGRLVERGLFQGDDIMYLPRDQVIPVGRTLPPRRDMVLPSQVVEHFIRLSGRRWIMHKCLCRDASHCRDHPIDLGCLFLGEATLKINPRQGRAVSVDEALDHVRRCREAGLVHLIGRNKLDAVWLNVRPGERLMTICNCCSCCCLWRILPEAAPRIADKVTRMPGVRVTASDRCVGCGKCADGVCFARAISLVDGRAVINDDCRGCGRCAEICPKKAIEVVIDPALYLDAAVERLSRAVDVR